LDDTQYWQMVNLTWTDSDNIWQYRRLWRKLWLSQRSNRSAVMEPEEQGFLAKLPDVLMIYRGTALKANMRGLSWTLDRNRAIWFAERRLRGRRRAHLFETAIRKSDALAYFSCRSEDEIVVHPDTLRSAVIRESVL
jgi:hypothetical protein